MTTILACIDGSHYTVSVCDHAAALASRMQADITLLHVSGEAVGRTILPKAELVMAMAVERLADHGIDEPRCLIEAGEFVEQATRLAAGADMVVAGKRGARSDGARRQLGENVSRLLRGLEAPLCLVSQVFLPISRALVLVDSDPDHRRTVEFVTTYPTLRELDIDLVMMASKRADASVKLAWARALLKPDEADIIVATAGGLDEAATQYLDSSRTDLFVLSRELLFAGPETLLTHSARGSFWRWRAPVLIC